MFRLRRQNAKEGPKQIGSLHLLKEHLVTFLTRIDSLHLLKEHLLTFLTRIDVFDHLQSC